MPQVTVHETEEYQLVFDTDDVDLISTPADYEDIEVPGKKFLERRLTGVSHLNITFKEGKAARWIKRSE